MQTLDWAPFPDQKTKTTKKKQNRGAGEQNAADLMKQHVQFTVCVCFLSDSTTLELTRPDGIISSLAPSITETAPALQEAQWILLEFAVEEVRSNAQTGDGCCFQLQIIWSEM